MGRDEGKHERAYGAIPMCLPVRKCLEIWKKMPSNVMTGCGRWKPSRRFLDFELEEYEISTLATRQ